MSSTLPPLDGNGENIDEPEGQSEANRAQQTAAEHVPDAAHGVDELRFAVGVDFVAQVADIDVDDVGCVGEVEGPDRMQQLRAADRAVDVAHEVLEQLVLARAAFCAMGDGVELQIGDLQRLRDGSDGRARGYACSACAVHGRRRGRRVRA